MIDEMRKQLDVEARGPETPTMDAATQAAWDEWCDSRIARLFDGEIGECIAEFTSEYVSKRLSERKAVEDEVAALRAQVDELRDAVAALQVQVDALADDAADNVRNFPRAAHVA